VTIEDVAWISVASTVLAVALFQWSWSRRRDE
jgi:hypothetical protein